MKAFLDDDFLLTTPTARRLYQVARSMPILDYHCHLDPKEIAQDRRFENITQVWLGGDHYKWRLMRANGVDEAYITGDAPDREKFQKWAETLELAIGNPLYHWSHLELRRYFGYEGVLNGDTAQEVWELCNQKLQEPGMSARNLIANSGVTLVCTTDDPADSLEWHQQLAQESSFPVKVLPAWRPDAAMGLERPEYLDYLQRLGQAAGVEIRTYADLKEALLSRMAFFDKMGCRASDHALTVAVCQPASEEELERVFQKRLEGEPVTGEELAAFQTGFLRFVAGGVQAAGLGDAAALRVPPEQQHADVRQAGPGHGLRRGAPGRALPGGGGVSGSAGLSGRPAPDGALQPEPQRRRRTQLRHRLFPGRRPPGPDSAGVRLVV